MSADTNPVSRPETAREVTLLDLWRVVWDGKYLLIGMTGLLTAAAVAYALLATEWYRADTLLMPADTQGISDMTSQVSGLAAIAGVRTSSGTRKTEGLAVLRSRDFIRDFITDLELAEILTADAVAAGETPDERDVVKFFREDILRVNEDRDTGLVTVSVQWTDPVIAANWVNLLVTRLNERMRNRATEDAEANVRYLREQMSSNQVVALDQAIGRIMESEMQKLMLARGNQEYAFRVIDKAEPPRKRSRPRRTLIVVSVFVVSGILSLVVVFLRSAIRHSSANTSLT